jgi:Peptidase_C39 like family
MSWADTAAHAPRQSRSLPVREFAYLTEHLLTDLFVAAFRLNPAAVERRIPPACRRSVDEAVTTVDGEVAVVETAAWTPRRGARHLVPSFSLLAGPLCSFRFELSGLVGGHWTSWIVSATIGAYAFPPAPPSGGPLAVDVDLFRATAPVESVRVRVRVHPASALAHPMLVTLSACDLDPVIDVQAGHPHAPRPELGARSKWTNPLRVPARSQMDEQAEIRERICSPTSVAMVLEYWGKQAPVKNLAPETFHPELDLYGIWPAAIAAAARRGVAGYLLRFPDWSVASWCLAQGLPVIASIRYEVGELGGAPIPRTDGHLVVLTGEDITHVHVNDPAGRAVGEVPRRYRRGEVCRAWLERGGVGYVLFPLEHEAPTRSE